MSSSNTEAVSGLDRVKLAFAFLIFVVGFIGFYWFTQWPMVARVGIFLFGLVLAAFIAWFSGLGKHLLSFVGASYVEVKRVAWPTRKETMQMTGVVFGFVLIMGVFLWLLDKGFEWIIYGLLLGWK